MLRLKQCSIVALALAAALADPAAGAEPRASLARRRRAQLGTLASKSGAGADIRSGLLALRGRPSDVAPEGRYNATQYHHKRKGGGYRKDPQLVAQEHAAAERRHLRLEENRAVFLATVCVTGLALGVLFCCALAPQVVIRSKAGRDGAQVARVGVYDRLFLRHKNPAFADDFELAARGAFFVCLVGLPFLLPRSILPGLVDEAVQSGMYTPMAVTYFVYTLYKSVGETVYFARCGILGTLVAVLCCFLMYGCFPQGVRPSDLGSHWISHGFVFWFGTLTGLLFVWLMFWLNLDGLTRVFALSTFVWFWMDFLNPNRDHYASGFRIEMSGTAVGELLECCIGCLMAVLAVLLPRPVWAMVRLKRDAAEAVAGISGAWVAFLEDVFSGTWSEEKQELILGSLHELHEVITAIEAHVANSWYECFGLGSRQEIRRLLAALQQNVRDSHDNITGTVASLRIQPCSEILQALKMHARRVVIDANTLSKLCVELACKGTLMEQDVVRISGASKQVQEGIAVLTREFEERKNSLGLSEELLNEHVFCFSMCVYGRYTVEYAQTIVADKALTATLHAPTDWFGHFKSTYKPDVLMSWSHNRDALKNTFTILLGFVVGYHGYMHMFSSYNASIASTMSLLISPFVGSAMVKNLGRLQGVIFGMVVGQLLFAVFGLCFWWGYVGTMLSLFAVTYLGLFLYYHSTTTYSTVGCLLAAFLAGNLLQGCLEHPSHFRPQRHYNDIVGIVTAIGLLVAVDLITARSRVSDDAHLALVDSLKVIRKALFNLFNSREPKSRYHSGLIADSVNSAAFLGSEAGQEPRFWRTSWKGDVFGRCVESFHCIRLCLSCAEMCTSEQGRNGALKTQALLTLSEMPSFQRLPPIIAEKVDSIEKLIGILKHETPDLMEEIMDPELQKDYTNEWGAEMRRFLGEVTRAGIFKGLASAATVEQDPAAQLSVVFAAMTGIVREVSRLRGVVIKSAT